MTLRTKVGGTLGLQIPQISETPKVERIRETAQLWRGAARNESASGRNRALPRLNSAGRFERPTSSDEKLG
jgi:hypothetical protein